MNKNGDIIEMMKSTGKLESNSFPDRLTATKKRLIDGYSNKLLGVGKDDKRKKFNHWDLSNDSNNWLLWLAMYNDSWIFRRAIDKPSQDVVNLELNISGIKSGDQLSRLKKEYNSLKFNLIQLLMWGALFGGSVGVMLFDNVALDQMDKPLSVKIVENSKSLKLHIVDRWNGLKPHTSDLVMEMGSDDFLKPRYYDVTIGRQQYKIHYSYILRYEHRVAPSLLRNGELAGWGYPEGVHLVNELMRDEKIKNSITSLIDKSLIEIIKMSGMRGVFMGADQDNELQLRKRLEMVNWARNYNSLTFLDKDDDYQQNEFGGLSGLSDLMDKNMENIAAALDMTGILYGDMSGGFSPDNYSLVRYDTTIRNRAENYFRPLLRKLLNVIKIKVGIKEELDFEFKSMIQIQEQEPLERMEKIISILSSMISDGYMTPQQAGQEVMKFAKESGIGESISEESLKQIKEDVENESEWINEREEDE